MLENVVLEYGGTELDPLDVYKDIFRIGSGCIQKRNEPKGSYKANPIAYFKNENEKHGHFRIMFEDEFERIYKDELFDADFCVMNGISYFGAKYLSDHASKMYAMIFDLDGVTDDSLTNFFYAAYNKKYYFYPIPNYIALSGHGVHLYYVFDDPVPLFPNIKTQLKELKYALTNSMWNKNTSNEENVQRQGINQPFRILGGKTKKGAPVKRVKVFRIKNEKTTLDELNKYVSDKSKIDVKKIFKESKMTLDQVRERYPEWYQNKIVEGHKKYWSVKRDLYDWWKRQIQDDKNGASFGHRYFCIMVLSIYAVKCNISRDELEKDAYELIPFMNAINKQEAFTEDDVRSALECYDDRYNTFPLHDIEKLTDIRIERNKRNYRTQKQHIKIMNAIRDIEYPNGEWINRNGAPTKEDTVREWREAHPDGTKADCKKDTSISWDTIRKWW